ncbi:MAG: hypothetical protein N4J56_007383 [Chroococcidiopsis sp. SAG 2025]|uniref:hypothetical protein n=1 Tax=Chroococcidiopsis sp. SAG 2025 TaxID=171389 RepID=UPI0029370904|nr:hypothetical protein [Chroococcidiopsis sp. SAG 2025]MDV2997678.1 hypothetical protein [Chroococcidiopsis sp. SAG 2025]
MANIILSESVLVESKSARDRQLEGISASDATDALTKVKALYFALWKGEGIATTEQMAAFYEVSVEAVQKVIQRHRDELDFDSLKTLRGKALKDVMDKMSITSKAPSLTIWTPRAALRLGMLLRDSPVAKVVRTSLLDAVEKVIPAQSDRIRELELENQQLILQLELAKTQERLAATTSAIATLHGSGMVALILGKPDAVVERVTQVETTILCNERGQPIKSYTGLSKTKLAKRYGMKKAADVVTWLESIGKADLLQSGLTAAPCQYLPLEYLSELDRLWAMKQGHRQRLLGE